MFKRLFLMAAAALNIAMLTGCGTHNLQLAPVGMERQASVHTVFAAGHAHKLGFDLDRYQKVQAPLAHPRQLPPTQGIAPRQVDLRAQCSPVQDQYDLASCTSFAVGKGMRELIANKRHEQATPLSPLFLYYETRRLRGKQDQDSGATITDAMKAIATAGDAPEALWPYLDENFDKQPPAEAYKAAGQFKLTTGVQLAGLADIKTALAKGQPVVFGMRIYNTFQSIGADGKLEMPQAGDVLVGGHAVCVVGYDNARKVLIIRNSFGEQWGDHGYFYMPYAYVTPDNVMDIWTAS